jgi:tRNA(fMet)-specific endonuclease VapC
MFAAEGVWQTPLPKIHTQIQQRRPLQNLPRYLGFIAACIVVPLGRETSAVYAQTRLALKRKGRPIPMNDIWIAAQCLEQDWVLVTDDTDFDFVDGLILEHW